ncbi:hypothetical protein GGH92_005260 [Coemansia sp. RSA 2673]|nr:hypothetical protein GGH13_006618 [Coemansia sp. S155-1]KAJ2342696.1 hypothetical protein GGH92_005260 [Coemansia sp. RSA 2673]
MSVTTLQQGSCMLMPFFDSGRMCGFYAKHGVLTLHEYRHTLADEKNNFADSLVEDTLITEIMSGAGILVCRQAPLTSTKRRAPTFPAYDPSASPEY